LYWPICVRIPLYWTICVFRKCIQHRVKVWRDCVFLSPGRLEPNCYSWLHLFLSDVPFSVVVSDETGVELFFLSRTVSTSGEARRFCVTLPPSTFTVGGLVCPETTPKKIEIEQFFFWTVGRLVTVTQVREVYRVLGQGDIRFLFC
jgi:hypothetical protein